MRPIGRIRARTMSKALRDWLRDQLLSRGWHMSKSDKRDTGKRWRGPGHYWIGPVAAYTSLLSAAKASGIRAVPAI